MIAFFNNAIVIGFAGFIADYIRKRYQLRKQTLEKQDELLNDLSHHISNVVGETSLLIMELSNCITGGKVDFLCLTLIKQPGMRVLWSGIILMLPIITKYKS